MNVMEFLRPLLRRHFVEKPAVWMTFNTIAFRQILFAAYVVFLQTFWGRVGLSRSDTLNCLAWFSCLLLDFLRHQSDIWTLTFNDSGWDVAVTASLKAYCKTSSIHFPPIAAERLVFADKYTVYSFFLYSKETVESILPLYSYWWKRGWSWPCFNTTLPALLCKSCYSYAD